MLNATALYARLSKEESRERVSASIENQLSLLRNFAKMKEDIHVAGEWIDDGYSGVDFMRPGFQAMMAEIEKGHINCILVKDFSRFARNYLLSGIYIERIFPQAGVRFLSVLDGYDSDFSNQSLDMVTPLKNLIHDFYARDISRKIKTVLDVKRRNGVCVQASACYGYQKAGETLQPDPFAAEIVKRIFRDKIEGKSNQTIAEAFNREGVLSPYEYKKRQRGKESGSGHFKTKAKALWHEPAISKILRNPVYLGVLAQGKTTVHFRTKMEMKKPEKDWIVFYHHHESLVSEEEFLCANEMLMKNRRG